MRSSRIARLTRRSASSMPASWRAGPSNSRMASGNWISQRRQTATFSSAAARRWRARARASSCSTVPLRPPSRARWWARSERARPTSSCQRLTSLCHQASRSSTPATVRRTSAAATASASCASLPNFASAACRRPSASIESTCADGFMRLSLLEVLLDALGLAQEVGDVFAGRGQEAAEHQDGLVELLGELVVLLVAPGVAQGGELSLDDAELMLQLAGKVLQVV